MGRYNIPIVDATNPAVLIADLQNIVDDIDNRLNALEGEGGGQSLLTRVGRLEREVEQLKKRVYSPTFKAKKKTTTWGL